MLTPYLEKLIHDGKAEYRELPIGGSGVGTIPLQPNEKCVITDFVWNPFCDVRGNNPIYSIGYFPVVILNLSDIVGPIVAGDTITGLIGLAPAGTAIVLSVDLLNSTIVVYVVTGDFAGVDNITDGLTTATITSLYANSPLDAGTFQLDTITGGTGQVLVNSPSATLNFSPGTILLVNVIGSFTDDDLLLSFTGAFSAVTNGNLVLITNRIPVLVQLALDNCIHTIRFRSNQVEASWNFKDLPTPILVTDDSGEIPVTDLISFDLPDPIQVHCYIFCPETVQIDIFKFSPSGNVFTMGTIPAKSAEPFEPNGYRSGAANVVRKIGTGAGATVLALGFARESILPTARTKQELVDDIVPLTELAPPFDNNSFPIVNIGYVILKQPRKVIV